MTGALAALLQKSEPVLVWANSHCIDQQNRDERMQQVQLMTTVKLSLWQFGGGLMLVHSSVAIIFLFEIATHANSPEKVTQLIATRVERRDFSATVSLFERDYWRRLWIVQEVFNARDITVYCGKYETSLVRV